MSDQHDPIQLPDEPGTASLSEPMTEDELEADGLRADPRMRPPDPAGTRPEWDPKTLLPQRRGQTAPGALWRPASPEDDEAPRDDDRERQPVGAVSAAYDDAGTDDAPSTSRFNPRFQFALGALMAIAAAAVVLFVAVLAGRGDRQETVVQTGPTWSAWHPSAGDDGAAQIADHVGHQYRRSDGKQLVAVTGGPLQLAGLPVTVAVRETAAQGGDYNLLDGNGVLFRMCGLGKNCAIPQGKPSFTRLLLLRREALELALYSFRYLGASDATVLLPPAKGQKPSQALFFRRQDPDLQKPMSDPLQDTLVQQTPKLSNVRKSPDAQLVDSLTGTKMFKVSFTQGNMDARFFMVLDPLDVR